MRAYMVTVERGDGGVAVVADTAREAKVWVSGHENFGDAEFIDLRVRWCRKVDVEGLPKGEMDLMEGLRRGAYWWAEGIACPACGDTGYPNRVFCEDGKFHCDACTPTEAGEVSGSE